MSMVHTMLTDCALEGDLGRRAHKGRRRPASLYAPITSLMADVGSSSIKQCSGAMSTGLDRLSPLGSPTRKGVCCPIDKSAYQEWTRGIIPVPRVAADLTGHLRANGFVFLPLRWDLLLPHLPVCVFQPTDRRFTYLCYTREERSGSKKNKERKRQGRSKYI